MSAAPSSVGTRDPARSASRDLIGAWLSMLFLLTVLGAMPFVPALTGALGYDVEESFGAGLLVLVPFLLVVLLLAAAALGFGIRSHRRGRSAGLIPAAISGAVAGAILVLQVVAIVGHLLGVE